MAEINKTSMDTPSEVSTTKRRSVVEATMVDCSAIDPKTGESRSLDIRTSVDAIKGTLPTSKGGTGISKFTGGKVLASNPEGTSVEETELEMLQFNGLRGNIQDQIDDGYSDYDVFVGNIDELRGDHTCGAYLIDPTNEANAGHMPFAEPFLLSVISAGTMGVQTAFAQTSGYVKNRIVKPGVDNSGWTAWLDFGISPNVQLRTYRITITPDGWTEIADGGWYKDIPVDGLLEKDNPTVGLIPQGANTAEVMAEREAFCCVARIDTYDGIARVFCFDKIVEVSICVGIQCNGT